MFDIEADPRYKDAVESAEYQEVKQGIAKLEQETTQINEDLKNMDEKYAEEFANLEKLKAQFEEKVEELAEVEKNDAESEKEEKEKEAALEALNIESENTGKQYSELIENMKTAFLDKSAYKVELESTYQKLINVNKMLDEAEKEEEDDDAEEEELKRKIPRRRSQELQLNATYSVDANTSGSLSPSVTPAPAANKPISPVIKMEAISELEYQVHRPAYLGNHHNFKLPIYNPNDDLDFDESSV